MSCLQWKEHWLLSCIIALDRNRLAMILSTLLDVLYASQGISSSFSTTCCDWIVKLSTPVLSSSADNKEPRKCVRVSLWKQNFRNAVTWFSAGWGEQMLLYVSSSFSPTARESHSHNWASSLCAGPQLYSCSRTITHDQDNINTSKLILQRRRERLQEQPSCQKPLLSCSPFRHWLFRSAF